MESPKYKVLMPVTVFPEDVSYHVKHFSPESLVLVNNFRDDDVFKICQNARRNGATVYHCPFNLGLASSWNIGLLTMYEEDLDFILVIAPSLRWSKDPKYWIDRVMDLEQDPDPSTIAYTPDGNVNLHCTVYLKRFKPFGLFDENFWPIYLDDTDMCARSWVQNREKISCLRKILNESEFCTTLGYSRTVTSNQLLGQGHILNAHRRQAYFTAKWGSDGIPPKFLFPFNDPLIPLHSWVISSTFNNPFIDNSEWRHPNWSIPSSEITLKSLDIFKEGN